MVGYRAKNEVLVTISEYNKVCRKQHTENLYLTEEETRKKVRYLLGKYNLWDLIESSLWFEYQVEAGEIVGIKYSDFYLADQDLDAAFRKAAVRHGTI